MAAGSSLATRCPACGTVFRVVPDQLRVSDGWVRCGRCAEVFSASASLMDMETGAPHRLPDSAVPALTAAAGQAVGDASEEKAGDAAGGDLAEAVAEVQTPEVAPVMPAVEAAPPWFDAPDPRAEPDDRPPSFVRRADRAARWRQPRVRLALAGAATAAALALALQITFEYRDLAAARWPVLGPALEQVCGALGCRVEAARAINGLAVQSSGLVRVEHSSLYKLAVTLRNHTGIDVALPAFDLTLTDSQGRLVARRVLAAAELGSAQATVAAGRELVLQATLQVAATAGTDAVAGYTIELFYP